MAAEHLYPSQCAIKKKTSPTETEQKEFNRTTIPAQVTRSLRPGTQICRSRLGNSVLESSCPQQLTPLQHNITEQFPARYVLREGETWEANARYDCNLRSLKPLLKAALQRARYCMAVDSTCRSDLPIDNLMPDVLVLTMPLSRFAEIAEMVGAIYDPNRRGSQKEPPPQRVIFANLLDHMACEGLLRDLDAIMSDVRRPGDIAALVNVVVGAMDVPQGFFGVVWERSRSLYPHQDLCTGHEVCSSSSTFCWRYARRAESNSLSVHQTCVWTERTCAQIPYRIQPSLPPYLERSWL